MIRENKAYKAYLYLPEARAAQFSANKIQAAKNI